MGASERSSKAIRRRLKAVSPKDSAESDHASQEAVRRLIPPTPCPLAPSVTTPLYRTIVSQALPNALRGGVFLDTLGPRESGDGIGEATPTLSTVPFGAEGYGVRLPGLSSPGGGSCLATCSSDLPAKRRQTGRAHPVRRSGRRRR